MSNVRSVFLVLAVVFLGVSANGDILGRQWSSRDGRSFGGWLVGVRGDNAVIQRVDGVVFAVPIERLVLEDQQYLKEFWRDVEWKERKAIGINSESYNSFVSEFTDEGKLRVERLEENSDEVKVIELVEGEPLAYREKLEFYNRNFILGAVSNDGVVTAFSNSDFSRNAIIEIDQELNFRTIYQGDPNNNKLPSLPVPVSGCGATILKGGSKVFFGEWKETLPGGNYINHSGVYTLAPSTSGWKVRQVMSDPEIRPNDFQAIEWVGDGGLLFLHFHYGRLLDPKATDQNWQDLPRYLKLATESAQSEHLNILAVLSHELILAESKSADDIGFVVVLDLGSGTWHLVGPDRTELARQSEYKESGIHWIAVSHDGKRLIFADEPRDAVLSFEIEGVHY